ncbi:hypothetical protein JCM10914A_55720 [Paenibacillus sp. JCM 10914]|uniref:hypothetical protein n=1 Tax=Paenibacillus sp. JCM 10914 TaxID=1236974 RepID=UPI0003CCBB17|nr:hypothetical protein [Paenibacillus sp. JCM 10914]GAE09625.1 hypothetical protein JCM10914_5995 [Paenibacillus sp. JCM 10914]
MKDKKTPIELDKVRYIMFDLNAFYETEQHFGSFNGMIEQLNTNPKGAIPLLLWIGLLHDDEALTVEQTIEWTHDISHYYIAEKILQAVSIGLPESNTSNTTNKPSTDTASIEKGWDWAWFFYMGTVLFNRSEAVFWRTTPRKLFAMWDIHRQVNGLDQAQPESKESAQARAFVDQYL